MDTGKREILKYTKILNEHSSSLTILVSKQDKNCLAYQRVHSIRQYTLRVYSHDICQCLCGSVFCFFSLSLSSQHHSPLGLVLQTVHLFLTGKISRSSHQIGSPPLNFLSFSLCSWLVPSNGRRHSQVCQFHTFLLFLSPLFLLTISKVGVVHVFLIQLCLCSSSWLPSH